MDGGLILTQFASSEPAVESGHWIEWFALFGALIFALIAIILILYISFSKKEKIISGPIYIRKAPDILKWIAIAAPTFMTFSFLIGFYDSFVDIGYMALSTEDNYTKYILRNIGYDFLDIISELILGIIIGLCVSLLCLVGIAIHFFRTMHNNE